MSKAFLRESDFEEPAEPLRLAATLPPGAKNYVTEEGLAGLRAELTRLVDVERPPLASRAADVEARAALQAMDQRIRHLQERIRTAVVGTEGGPPDVVRFGATVTVREAGGAEERYRIVGMDEADAGRNWISWQSPLARALMHARTGQRVVLQMPRRKTELEIVEIAYETVANRLG